jgi:sirohydrochlorin cobaltochelatase
MTSGTGAGEVTVIVLAMHGVPPRDFPPAELAELMALSGRLGHGPTAAPPELARRHAELDGRIRSWPRSEANDPFFVGSQALASRLSRETRWPVVVGFNEFCAPGLDDALDAAVTAATRVLVVTPMMTVGGEHAEIDIPAAIERARTRHPAAQFIYAWPFEASRVVRLLADQVRQYAAGTTGGV